MKMTINKVFLDTNVIIEIFSGNPRITEEAAKHPALYISSIVLGELYTGINRVQNKSKHLQKLISFLSLCRVLVVDEGTAQIFGEITAELYKKGKPIPTNDIWIAQRYVSTILHL